MKLFLKLSLVVLVLGGLCYLANRKTETGEASTLTAEERPTGSQLLETQAQPESAQLLGPGQESGKSLEVDSEIKEAVREVAEEILGSPPPKDLQMAQETEQLPFVEF
ncbi:hypothetical protein EBT16_11895 [bacterium]|nr:hypothetical protein [bacterium]